MTDSITAAALVIAKEVYGGIKPGSKEWEHCLDAAAQLVGSMVITNVEDRYAHAQVAFESCAQFNRDNPLGTEGVIVFENGAETRVRIDGAALVFSDPMGGERIMGWFSNVGWRPIANFQRKLEPITIAQELMALGRQAKEKGAQELAMSLFDASIVADPTYWHAWNEKGSLLNEQQQAEKAIEAFREALKINPRSGEVLNNLGMLLRSVGKAKEALESCQEALRWLPGNGLIALNCASAYDDMGLVDECLAIIDEHILRNPFNPNPKYNRGIILLGSGKLEQGWKEHDWRLSLPNQSSHYEHYDIPRWRGKSLVGKNILIWPEQGIGDEIMTTTMIPDLIQAGATITLLASERLVPLFRRSFPLVTVDRRTGAGHAETFMRARLPQQYLPAAVINQKFDYQASQTDLGLHFRPSMHSFPDNNVTLLPAPLPRATFDALLEERSNGKSLVGISWNSHMNMRIGRLKGTALVDWESILRTPGVTFVNLQYGAKQEEIDAACEKYGCKILNFTNIDPLQDMDTFASLVATLDLVITVSNTTAHVAGALGKQAWVMTPEGPGRLWYWFRDRTSSPWYPSLRLFRQPGASIWAPVIKNVADALKGWLHAVDADGSL